MIILSIIMSNNLIYFICPYTRTQKESIYEWLNNWIIIYKIKEHFVVNNHLFYHYAGFQYAFYVYCIYYDVRDKKYIWYTCENFHININKFMLCNRYDTYDYTLR